MKKLQIQIKEQLIAAWALEILSKRSEDEELQWIATKHREGMEKLAVSTEVDLNKVKEVVLG